MSLTLWDRIRLARHKDIKGNGKNHLGAFMACNALILGMVGCASAPEHIPSNLSAKVKPVPAIGTWGFDTTAMDRSVKPGDDFDRYANGAWQDRTTIPNDKSNVSMFTEVNERVQKQLQTLLEESAADRNAEPGSNRQILGDWYASYLDVTAIEAAGLKPVRLKL
ncbi:MAG: M13 family metallopeptidase N-terminal domain-containing protein [Methylococcales bacterium]|nr:M13 family metallopeptidase N-terminal domain-containing protein [Methylococcales bacterium]